MTDEEKTCRCCGNYCGDVNVPTGKTVRRRIVGAAPPPKKLTTEQAELVKTEADKVKKALKELAEESEDLGI